MKKLIIIYLILWLVLLWGCNNNKQELELLKKQNSLLQEKIDQQENLLSKKQKNDSLSREELFEWKKECISYKEEIEELLFERYKEARESAKTYEDIWPEEWEQKPSTEKLQEIFYSPVRNSCLYIVDRTFFDTCKEEHTQKIVYDFFDSYDWWLIGSEICPCSKSKPGKLNCEHDNYFSIDEEIKKLKWE